MYCLHSSFHLSFLGVLLCVCITSFAASIIASFIFSHSSSMLFMSGIFSSLLCNDVLYCLSLLGFCIFVFFSILLMGSVSFYICLVTFVLGLFSVGSDQSRYWGLAGILHLLLLLSCFDSLERGQSGLQCCGLEISRLLYVSACAGIVYS